jgi:hypothetical protein
VADKLTQQIVDALSRAAADPNGLPLFASKGDAGLFPAVPAGKTAAQKCLSDDLLRSVTADPRVKSAQPLYGLTDAGWTFLLAAADPKQVLEDFVRVLESRQGEVDQLLGTARRMADHLQGLRDAVARVLPRVAETRVPAPARTEPAAPPSPPPAPPDLGDTIRARLAEWSAAAQAGEDCPLPELYRFVNAGSIGAFHDALRRLQARGAVYLHSWTGPLYALPEPTFALLVGHGVAYYASLRKEPGAGGREAGRLAAAAV